MLQDLCEKVSLGKDLSDEKGGNYMKGAVGKEQGPSIPTRDGKQTSDTKALCTINRVGEAEVGKVRMGQVTLGLLGHVEFGVY